MLAARVGQERQSGPERLDLIASDRVRGTKVYGQQAQHIGEIDSFVIDKPSGRIVYAMMTFGGFLGIGEDIYPIPWSKLHYDTELGGYRTDLTQEMVEGPRRRGCRTRR
ncbi:MAG: PRC-barrel domain-containing protein [Burkholderiaceae bacterium]